jgi:hypothetical protein
MAKRDEDTGQFTSGEGDEEVPTQETTEEPLAQDADATPYTDEDDDDRDDDGNLIDPPIIPSHERELQEASASGDNDAVAAAQEKYTQAREDHVSAARERERGNGQ